MMEKEGLKFKKISDMQRNMQENMQQCNTDKDESN